MKLSREELLEKVRTYVGDRTDDESLSLIEDVNDTVVESDSEDWKTKYDELDKTWREKYKARFFSGKHEETEDESEEDSEEEKESYDDLFEEKEDK